MKLRIGHLSTLYHTSMLLMAEKNILRKSGINPEWRLFGTGPAILRAFETQDIDLAYMGLPPAIIGINNGLAIKCIAGGHMEGTVLSGRSSFIGYPEKKSLADIFMQLQGLKIGVPGIGSIHDVILKDCLDRFSLPGKISVINFSWADQVMEAFVKEQVSAVIGTPALSVAVKKFSDGRMLYPPAMLWPNNPSYGILANSRMLEAARPLAEQFLVCHEEASVFLMEKTDEASQIISDYLGFIDKEFALDVLMVSPKYCSMLSGPYIDATMQFVRIMKKLGYIKREILSEEIFDKSLISNTHPSKAHYEDY